ncbi:MAG: ABC transporter ATP-binding protein [Gemmataceae bacterium]
MIVVDQLSVRAGTFALDGISFEIPEGQCAALMGKTGSGKTTILEAICGLKPMRSGSVRLHGRDVTGLRPAERGIGYVPQDRALFPTMTVREHLAFALVIRKWEQPAIAARVQELADLLGIVPLLERRPHGLSGGEAQRVAVGRALSCKPAVLLLDEPLSALDEETREEMCQLLTSVRAHTGVTTLHVTHSLGEAKRLAHKILYLRNGAIASE